VITLVLHVTAMRKQAIEITAMEMIQ